MAPATVDAAAGAAADHRRLPAAEPRGPAPAGCPDDDDQGEPGTAWGLTFPPHDPACDGMVRAQNAVAPWRDPQQAGAMNWSVPRAIHEVVWDEGAAANPQSRGAWRSYAARFGYSHHAWSLDDDGAIGALVPAAQLAAFTELRDRTSRRAARTLLAYHVLERHGGIFVGDETQPPSRAGELVDVATRLPMRGAAFVTALHARNVGHVSVYLTCELMAAAAGHPLLGHLVRQAFTNVAALRGTPTHARYLTGAAFLSRQLTGVFTIVPYHTMQQLGVFG